MRIAQLDWPLFWHALNQQDSANRNRCLGRWIFADDQVRLSIQPAPAESGDSNLTNDGEVPEVLSAEILVASNEN